MRYNTTTINQKLLLKTILLLSTIEEPVEKSYLIMVRVIYSTIAFMTFKNVYTK